MNDTIKIIVIIGLFVLLLPRGNAQSIGYSLSYTLPYSNINDNFRARDGGTYVQEYSKGI